eukprot:9469048-Pyramimonas_sp.AAC.1
MEALSSSKASVPFAYRDAGSSQTQIWRHRARKSCSKNTCNRFALQRAKATRPTFVLNASVGQDQEGLKTVELQQALRDAVDREDYAEAARLRDVIRCWRKTPQRELIVGSVGSIGSTRQDTEEEAVIAANSAFYAAFAHADVPAMRRIWGRGAHVQCIHPGGLCVKGDEPVIESWAQVLGTSFGGSAPS